MFDSNRYEVAEEQFAETSSSQCDDTDDGRDSVVKFMNILKSKSCMVINERNYLKELIESYFGKIEEKTPSDVGFEFVWNDSFSTIGSLDDLNLHINTKHKLFVDDFKDMKMVLRRFKELADTSTLRKSAHSQTFLLVNCCDI